GPASQIVVDKRGYLAQANARARGQFGLRSEDIGRPFHDLEISYRPVELRGPIEEVERSRKPSVLTGVNSGLGAGETHFDVEIIPLIDSAGSYLGVSLTFRDVTHYRELQLELENSNQELETAMEELQSTNEELETTNEELQSTNEELETTNEELQSTNEELETMNEELQSTNEELATVNEEMRDRTEEIGALHAFLEAVLETVRAGVAVVDEKGTVSVWNKVAEDLWGVRTDEVEGSSLFALDIGLDVDALKPLVKACITGASRFEEVRLDATNRRGRKISCHVTCAPLGTSSGAVENAILFMEADPSG
ncbi:MAG: PAS domain-containing protein, partial [Actinomycetota bacterium]